MKKIPIWAIYLADFICVLTALLIAFNYFIVGLPMDTSAILLCAFMILSTTIMMCTAQFFHFKSSKLSNENPSAKQFENIEENFQIIFKQVSAIKRDNSTLNANFTALLNRYNDTKGESAMSADKILADFESIKTKVDDIESRFAKEDEIAQLKLDLDENIDNFKADIEIELGKIDDLDASFKNLKTSIEEINIKLEDYAKVEVQEPKEDINKEEEENAEEDIFDYDDIEEEDYIDDDEEDGVDPSDNLSQISLMSRALNNTQQSQSVLGSFAKINEETQNAPEEIPANEELIGDFVDIDDVDDIGDLDSDLSDIMNLGNTSNGDTILSINAMLGLGNKPYIRGTAPELSEIEGVQMEFVEIGKWRYVFKDLSGSAKVSIWLNDEKMSNNGEISISEGDNLEIDTNFNQ